jgi:hypothetical protein
MVRVICSASLLFVLAVSPNVGRAEDVSAANLLPPSIILYAEIAHPDKLFDTVLDHPLREQLEANEDYQAVLTNQKYLEFKAVVSVIEAQIGKTWRAALNDLTKGGIAFAIDAETEGVAVLSRAKSAEAVDDILESLLSLVREDAKRKGNGDPIKSVDYRGVTAYQMDKAIFAVVDSWLLITNKGDLGKEVIDRLKDGGESLATAENFATAHGARADDLTAWAFFDVETLRESGVANDLYERQAENPVVELLIGGLQSVLQNTPYATASLSVESGAVKLGLATPFQTDWTPEERTYYFGPDAKGASPQLLDIEGRVLGIGTYRDASQMWLRAGDLFGQKVNDDLAQADSVLATLFSGRDFGEDILGAVHPEFQLIVARQAYENGTPTPAIQLPAFALATNLREPQKMQRELKRIFQSLIGFINVTGAMNGQPQFDIDMERIGEASLVTATYAPDDEQDKPTDARINFNFSPSIAFIGDQFIVSSTKGLARDLAQASNAGNEPSVANTIVHADANVLRQLLDDNRRHLVAQNMLEEGSSKEEAEHQIGLLLDVLSYFKDAQLQLQIEDDVLRLGVALELSESFGQ